MEEPKISFVPHSCFVEIYNNIDNNKNNYDNNNGENNIRQNLIPLDGKLRRCRLAETCF